jgi:hypothetical protein
MFNLLMSLGPPVCMRCRVIYNYKHSYGWECPICKVNDDKQQGNLFDCGISEEELEGNLRFLLFIKGIDYEKKE